MLSLLKVGDTVYVERVGGYIDEYVIDRVTPTQVCSKFARFRKKDGLLIGSGDGWSLHDYGNPLTDEIRHKLNKQRLKQQLWNEARYLEKIAKGIDDETYEQIKHLADGVATVLKEKMPQKGREE